MNVQVEEKLMSRIHQLEKQLTSALMKIELISGFLKKKFIDASFPIKMLGTVTLKRVKMDSRKVRIRTTKNLQKARANDKVGNSEEAGAGTTIKVLKSTPARNLEGFDNGLAVAVHEVQTETSELLNGTSGSVYEDGPNKNTFATTQNDCSDKLEVESTVSINNTLGEASSKSKFDTAELKMNVSVGLEQMEMETAPTGSSLSKHGTSTKSKASKAQHECSTIRMGEKRLKCTCKDCPRRFAQRHELEAHLRVHTGEKPLKCTWAHCNRRFAQRVNLTTHVRTHTGEKPFKCSWPECGKSFADSSNLIRHRRCHTGEKPYSCLLCGKSFSESGLRTDHMRIHTGEKPYKCDLCGAEYRCHTSFWGHKKTHTK